MTYIPNIDFPTEVSLGNIPGWEKINKFGQALDCDSGVPTDIWDGADGATSTDVWVCPIAARIHDLTSTNALDIGGGVGCQKIRVYGLTAWDADEVNELVIMNGTGNRATANAYVIIHRMVCEEFGVVGSNIGTITATAQTDATITAIVGVTGGVGHNQTLMAIYGVPSTKSIQIKRITAGILKSVLSVAADLTLFANTNPINSTAYPWIIKERFILTNTTPLDRAYDIPKDFDGPCIIKLQILTNTNNAVCTGAFDAYLVDQ